MLSELEDDMDTTHSRLKAAQVKMQDIIKRSGVGNQLYLIGGLILTLVLLTVLAFY